MFGCIAGLAALLIGAQAVSRRLWANRGDLDVLRSLGADTPTMAADAMLGPLCAVLLGAVLAVGVAVAFSPLMPIGPASQVDPSPGISFDWTVLLSGLAVLSLGLGGLTIVLAYRRAHATRLTNGASPCGRPGWSTWPPAPDCPNPQSPACASPSSAAAVAPPCPSARRSRAPCWRWRSWWRPSPLGAVSPPSTPTPRSTDGTGALPSIPPGPTTFRRSSGTSSAATRRWPRGPGTRSPMCRFDGLTVPTLLTQRHAELSPPILTGHVVDANNQIVLGSATLAALHKKVGDTVMVSYGAPRDAPVYVPPTPMVIVGTATMPAIGVSGHLHPSMGTGALLPDGPRSRLRSNVPSRSPTPT